MKKLICPNCSDPIETDNKISVTCDNCKYTFSIVNTVEEKEIKEKKSMKINS